MDKSIFRFVLRFSKREQLFVVLLTVISFPFLYYSLDLPKTIINEAIGGGVDFPVDPLGLGYELEQIPYLLTLCGIFLTLVFINGGFKYYINVYRGQLGERMLRRLRYELYSRVLRFRLPRFKRMSQGEIIPMITAEVDPLGGFFGDAFGLPAFQGGTLTVYVVFIFIQDPILGAAAISLYPLQAYIIPKLQRRVNQLGKQRVRTVRRLADRIGETVAGAPEIHAHDTTTLHRADISSRLGRIYSIRYEIFRRKFFIKFLNNFLNQLTPFFFYSIGGYLVLQGDLTFGSLVAVLAAYKDLSGPWRELLNYYQRVEDVRIKYEQVIEQFQPEDIVPMEQLDSDEEWDGPLPDKLDLHSVQYAEEDSIPVLNGVSVSLPTRGETAILGQAGSGRYELMQLLGRLLIPSGGSIQFGDKDYEDLPESVVGRMISYVGPDSYMFTDSLRANLYYGLKHRPLKPADYTGHDLADHTRWLADARASGNLDMDINADWIDYEAAGVADEDELENRALEVLRAVDMAEDIYRMGLNGTIDPTARSAMADTILQARKAIRERLRDPQLARVVELFDGEGYNESATVAENLLFGTPVGKTFSLEGLAEQPYVLKVLDKVGLTETFLEIGAKVAETMIELFADLPPGHEFFEQFSFISSDELPDFQPLVVRVSKEGVGSLKAEDRARLLALPFKLVPSRHRLGLVEGPLQERILEARRVFAAELPSDLRPAVEFFDADSYNAASTIQDNILFGKVRYGHAGSTETVQSLVGETVTQFDLRDRISAVGLDHSVGVAGARLSSVQRQKLALGRALLKRPQLLVVNEATSALDGAAQGRVHANMRRMMEGRGLIWAPHRPSIASDFDRVVVLKSGRVAAQGDFASLDQDGSVLRELIAAE